MYAEAEAAIGSPRRVDREEAEVKWFVPLAGVVATVLRRLLRDAEGPDGTASTLAFAGGILFAVGMTVFAGLAFSIGEVPEKLEPSTLQALHVLNNDMFFPVAIGVIAFSAGCGIAVVKTGVLPKWLGWVAIAIAVVSATPLFFISILVFALWIIVVSVLMTMRAGDTAAPPAGPPVA